MSELKPISGDKTLYQLIPDNKTERRDKIKPKDNNSGGENMSNYVTRDEFNNSMREFKDEMRAMRVDMNNNLNSIRTDMNNNINSLRSETNTNFNNLRVEIQSSISKLPSNSDVKNMLLENNKELEKEAKQNRNTIIGRVIGILGLGFTIAKGFGWI